MEIQDNSNQEQKKLSTGFYLAAILSTAFVLGPQFYFTPRLCRVHEQNRELIQQRQGLERNLEILKRERRKYNDLRTVYDDGFGNTMKESFCTDIKKARTLDRVVKQAEDEIEEIEQNPQYQNYVEKSRSYLRKQTTGTVLAFGTMLLYGVYELFKISRKSKNK
ncbi:hypothetical protein GF386_02685 [Candidatus Pacearchaeota archaeon]|nr:hypothetical protein [Candidatus Pacearchaeota archaeon]MBD3283055.1 hypothetical protein [Candidatus Pacearchaeota archaeon]